MHQISRTSVRDLMDIANQILKKIYIIYTKMLPRKDSFNSFKKEPDVERAKYLDTQSGFHNPSSVG